jgi:glycosyltransferase involved in cell wall biosynthesis
LRAGTITDTRGHSAVAADLPSLVSVVSPVSIAGSKFVPIAHPQLPGSVRLGITPSRAFVQAISRTPRVRLGIYADLVYHVDDRGVSTDRAFILFIDALAERIDELVLFGRLAPAPGRAAYAVSERIRFVALPHYARVTSIRRLLRSLVGARRTFAAELGRVDAVWLFGPHPIALELARIARARQVPVILGIRQDFPQYIAHRLPSRRWVWAIPVAHVLDHTFRLLARRLPTVVVGEALGARYGCRNGSDLLVTGISLVSRSTVAALEDAVTKDWSGELRLLSVGRVDAEKNPLLLPDILARLGRTGRWRLIVAGEGPLADAVAAQAAELGVDDRLELRGYVSHGDGLRRLYETSHALLHVSRTEGVPQVLFEALAAGLPVVATDVGGVAGALGHGERGLLVPPGNAAAAAEACERLRREPALRSAFIRKGLEFARAESIESQLDRLVGFLDAHA